MLLFQEFTFRGDARSKLLLEAVTGVHYGGYRVCALSSGPIAEWVWAILEKVAEEKLGVSEHDEFVRLLDEEYDVVKTALPEPRDNLRLQPIFGRFLHINEDPVVGYTLNMAGFAPYHKPRTIVPGSIRTILDTRPR